MPEYLFDHSQEIFGTIEKADGKILFLDYDGTLVFLKDKPDDIITPNKVKIVLEKLIRDPEFNIFIITGRTLHEIKNLLDIKGLSFAALHGLEVCLANGKKFCWKPSENEQSILKKIKEKVFYEFKEEKGIYIEDKGVTLAFHYRMLPRERVKYTTGRFVDIVKRTDEGNVLEIIKGAELIEIRSRGWNKGKATEFLLNNINGRKYAIPIYIGDDTTDEDAFACLKNRGLTIFVSNGSEKPTSAQYWLKNPDDVLVFLKSILTAKKEI